MSRTPHHRTGLGFFNQVRSVGILWVVAGHAMALFMPGQENAVALPLFAGAGRVAGGGIMVMFFMISGFFFYRRSPAKCITTQARLLLKPYFVTSIAILLTKCWLTMLRGRDFLGELFSLTLTYLLGLNAPGGSRLFGIPVSTISVFWFVLALFEGWVLYNYIQHLKHPGAKWICVVACVIIGWLLMEVSPVWPYVFPLGLMAVGYIAVGHLIRQHNLLERKLPVPVWLLVWGIALVSLAFGYVDIASGVWKLGLLDLLGTCCIAFLILRLYNRVAAWQRSGPIARCMEVVGLNSIWILCIHAFEKIIIYWKNLEKFFPNQPLLCMVICFAGRCAAMYLLWIATSHLRRQLRRSPQERIVITEE